MQTERKNYYTGRDTQPKPMTAKELKKRLAVRAEVDKFNEFEPERPTTVDEALAQLLRASQDINKEIADHGYRTRGRTRLREAMQARQQETVANLLAVLDPEGHGNEED